MAPDEKSPVTKLSKTNSGVHMCTPGDNAVHGDDTCMAGDMRLRCWIQDMLESISMGSSWICNRGPGEQIGGSPQPLSMYFEGM